MRLRSPRDMGVVKNPQEGRGSDGRAEVRVPHFGANQTPDAASGQAHMCPAAGAETGYSGYSAFLVAGVLAEQEPFVFAWIPSRLLRRRKFDRSMYFFALYDFYLFLYMIFSEMFFDFINLIL